MPQNPGLEDARQLVTMGVPVFAGRLTAEGEPYSLDPRWKNWQRTRPNTRPIDRWVKGEALGAVTGKVVDVIDVDPRNGGIASLNRMIKDLGGFDYYWSVRTSSGGTHYYVPTLGMGTHPGFLKGLDLKGEGGFVFIPPTVRPSKADGNAGQRVPYRRVRAEPIVEPNGQVQPGPLRDYIGQELADKRTQVRGAGTRGRTPIAKLEAAALAAGKGDQRPALLALADEWARVTGDDDLIADRVWAIAKQLKAFDKGWPWSEQDVSHLRHRAERRPAPDASGAERAELAELRNARPIASEGTYISADDIVEETVDWLNLPFLPFGCLVIIDGDPGQGKSLITNGLVARAASGLPVLPYGENADVGPIHCGMIGAEDDISQAVRGRLRAAGYVSNRHIWFMGLKRDKRGRIEQLTFPNGTERVRKFIADNGIRLLIVDPISAFLDEDTKSHVESSVRKALGPLGEIARNTGCCIVLVRHLNKDGSMKAMYRGGGSIAFSAIARSGLITGCAPDGGGGYAISQVKCSYAEKFDGAIRYRIARWDEDNSLPVISWGEHDTGLDADTLVRGPAMRRGPEPRVQAEIADVLAAMFDEKDTWPAKKCLEAIKKAGLTTHHATLDKVKERLGIRSESVHRRGGQFDMHTWTIRKVKVGDEK